MPERIAPHHESSLPAADTPKGQVILNPLPTQRLSQRLQGDTIQYLLADPEACVCLYGDSEQEYVQYRKYIAKQKNTTARLF
jgi:hypothetical protein